MLRKFVKRAGVALGAVVVGAGALALWVDRAGLPSQPHETPAFEVKSTPARVERGKKLASLLCNECHLDRATGKLTGIHLAELPKEFGEIWSKNITRHPEKGIGRWTDGELAYFLRTGVRPDGQYVPPYMVKLPHLSDEDMQSVIAFLRSDDPLVAPSDAVPSGTTKPSFLVKVLARTAFGPLPYPTAPVPMPPSTDRVAYGRYLTFALDCFSCHSADFKKMNVLEPEKSAGYMGGGNTLVDADGNKVLSANLTPDEETGIGLWSEADFVRAVKKGFRPDGRVLSAPMLPKAELDDDEVAAIYAYLRTVPKIRNAFERPKNRVAEANAHPGKAVYQRYGCASCHGEQGAGRIADLRSANERYPSDAALRAWIEDAPAQKPGTKMPAWKGIIKDDEYAPLIGYVRLLARPAKEASNR